MKALIRSEEHVGPALQRALQALELARWDALPDAPLPWTDVREAARRQGVSEADVVWDMCGKNGESAAHHAGGKQRRKGKTPARRTPS
ncbi:MAG: hypothetical protein ACR2N5_02355 [Solirubrobacterales bacterium]